MTTLEITIPDELARDAQQAGLLSSERIAAMLGQQLKATRVDAFFAAMDRMAAVDEPAIMSPEEVAEELALLRGQRAWLPRSSVGASADAPASRPP